jgi:type I restriction enzyme S subunit
VEAQDKIIATLKELKAATLAKLFREGLRGEPLKETEIGEIPESWEVVRLSTRCRITSGGTPSRGVSDYWGGTIPWVKTGEINYQEILDTEEHITEKGLRASSAKLFPAGTIIMAMYGQGVTRGRVAILGIDATTNQACAAFFPDGTLAPLFLYAFFVYSYENLRSLAHGGNQQNLSNDLLSSFLLPVPSDRAEQTEIGRILRTIEERLRIAEQRKANASALFSSMLHLLMTGEVRLATSSNVSPRPHNGE